MVVVQSAWYELLVAVFVAIIAALQSLRVPISSRNLSGYERFMSVLVTAEVALQSPRLRNGRRYARFMTTLSTP